MKKKENTKEEKTNSYYPVKFREKVVKEFRKFSIGALAEKYGINKNTIKTWIYSSKTTSPEKINLKCKEYFKRDVGYKVKYELLEEFVDKLKLKKNKNWVYKNENKKIHN